MGILKKPGSWKTNKHTKSVSFGFESYSTCEKRMYAKFCDGISYNSYVWLKFMEDIFVEQMHPINAWKNVSGLYTDYVWNMVLDVLDRYYETGRFMSMPRGCREGSFTIGYKYHNVVSRLETWVNYNVIRYGYEDLEKTNNYVYKKLDELKKFNEKIYDKNVYDGYSYKNDENDENDENDGWSYLKQNCCREDIIYLFSPTTGKEIEI